MAKPRFGIIPLPISNIADGVANEMMTQPSSGHIYIKQQDGTAVSKTVELEDRLKELEDRLSATNTHLTLVTETLLRSLVLPNGVSATILSNGDVRLTGPTSLTNALINFDKRYCNFNYNVMDAYIISVDSMGGEISNMSLNSSNGSASNILSSEMVGLSSTRFSACKLSAIVYPTDTNRVPLRNTLTPVIRCNFSRGAVTIRALSVSKMDINVLNAIDYGSGIHIDHRYCESHLIDVNGVVPHIISNGPNSNDSPCFKIFKTGAAHTGYLKIMMPHNVIKAGSYALQLVLRNNDARMLDITFFPTGLNGNFRVDTTTYTPDVNGRVTVNLKFEWDYASDVSRAMSYIMINCGNTDIALVESVHITRMYPAKYSDNSLWLR